MVEGRIFKNSVYKICQTFIHSLAYIYIYIEVQELIIIILWNGSQDGNARRKLWEAIFKSFFRSFPENIAFICTIYITLYQFCTREMIWL